MVAAKGYSRPVRTGCETIYGIPGSGKSFMAVERALRVMLEERRPVYTNLPLKMGTIRAYLRKRGGVEAVKLLRPLTERHFRSFLQRVGQFEELKKNCDKSTAESVLVDRFGPHVVEGNDANWIPACSVIVIDEAHHWFPNPALRGVVKPEPPELMTYLTMHRHFLHWIWVLTQSERQISNTFKSLASCVWMVRQRGFDKVAWGIQLRHLGIQGLGYSLFDPTDDPERDDPRETYTVFPWWPTKRVIFRMYDSFTNVASREELERALRDERRSAGLADDGGARSKSEAEVVPPSRAKEMLKRIVVRVVSFTLVGLLLMSFGAFMSSRKVAEKWAAQSLDDGGEKKSVKSSDSVAASQPSAPSLPELRAMSPDALLLSDGSRWYVGGYYGDVQLVVVEAGRGVCVARAGDGRMFIGRVGGGWREGSGAIGARPGASGVDRSDARR